MEGGGKGCGKGWEESGEGSEGEGGGGGGDELSGLRMTDKEKTRMCARQHAINTNGSQCVLVDGGEDVVMEVEVGGMGGEGEGRGGRRWGGGGSN